jgi:hypothetical protein
MLPLGWAGIWAVLLPDGFLAMLDDGFCCREGNRGRDAAKVKLGEAQLTQWESLEAYLAL